MNTKEDFRISKITKKNVKNGEKVHSKKWFENTVNEKKSLKNYNFWKIKKKNEENSK
jgi:hypothetical protein